MPYLTSDNPYDSRCSVFGPKFRKRLRFLSLVLLILHFGLSGCSFSPEDNATRVSKVPSPSSPKRQTKEPVPPLLSEILNENNSKTESPLGTFDFKNYTYPFTHGWQDRDSKEFTLENGVRRMTAEKIGMSFVTRKYGDLTGDGNDEAFVILKVETGGSAIPQIVYIFEWQDGQPNLLWYFRTGDRADGGLKRVYTESGELVVELFGRDRYIFSQMETSKITGDEQQLCCPTHFTRTRYKKEGKTFLLNGDRLTYSLTNGDEEPVVNMNEKQLEEERGTK